MADVMPAGSILGIDENRATSSGWAYSYVNRGDPVDVALAARVQINSAISHVARSTSKGYVGPWNAFVK